jgi:hypothetical protein
MNAPRVKPPVIEVMSAPQIFVDDLCQIDHQRGVTYLVFASTRRDLDGEFRSIEVRLVVPTPLVEAMAKEILNGCVKPAWKVGINGDEIALN